MLPDLAGCHLRFPGFGYWAAETRAGVQFIGWFGLRYTRTVHLDWPEPLDGNEHGDVEYHLLRGE